MRWVAIAVWAVVVVYRTVTDGFAFNRELLLLYICTGLAAASIGQGRRMLYVIRDWLPFALVLVAYDLSRGAADLIGRPTMWHWQVDADRWLFFGTMPTVWLQEHLKLPHPPWWEVVISTVYMSFFVLPYVVARRAVAARPRRVEGVRQAVRRRCRSRRLAIYALLPAAPPWAAARCTAADVEGGPSGPRCMFRPARGVPDGGLLGAMQTTQDGANGWIERIVGRGWGKLNMHTASALLDQGQASVNLVAAVPSLHAGHDRWRSRCSCGTACIAAGGRCWWRTCSSWRSRWCTPPSTYVIDILLGWALAAVVMLAINWFKARRAGPSPESGDSAERSRSFVM